MVRNYQWSHVDYLYVNYSAALNHMENVKRIYSQVFFTHVLQLCSSLPSRQLMTLVSCISCAYIIKCICLYNNFLLLLKRQCAIPCSLLCPVPLTIYLKIFLNTLFIATYLVRMSCNLFSSSPTDGCLYFQSFDVIKKTHHSSTVWPSNPFLGIYQEKTIILIDTSSPMFTAALFTIARTCKQPKCVHQQRNG